ncbi:MAG: DUF1232 domain-containing protein [Actinobacteria bacterium]|nr:DUF1232 domain-containing protein [Actinomycetota bacterium]
MSLGTALIVGIVASLVLYGLAVLALVAAGKRGDRRVLATFIPDCIVLFGRLLKDPSVPRRRKLLLLPLLAYLALPIDLVPDFIPVAGQLDDAILAAVVLRHTLRGGDPGLLAKLWPGPPEGLRVISRLTFGK